MKRSALILGSTGFLGGHSAKYFRSRDYSVIETSRRNAHDAKVIHIDLEDSASFSALPKTISVVVVASGVASVQRCEEDREQSRRVNVDGVIELCNRMAHLGSHIIYISTNLVFDGARPDYSEKDPVCPKTEYGRQRAEVEQAISKLPKISILRCTKVLDPSTALIVKWLRALRNEEQISPFRNWSSAPVSLNRTLWFIYEMAQRELLGIYHLSGERQLSYYELALELAGCLGVSQELVRAAEAPGSSVEKLIGEYATLDDRQSHSAFAAEKERFEELLRSLI